MRYSHDSWSIELPDNWQVEETLEVISFFHPDGVGTFDVSTFFKDEGEITIADIMAFSEVENPKQVELDFMNGIYHEEVEDNERVFHWWLATANQMIYATYVCADGQQSAESSERERMARSLRSLYQEPR